MKYPEGLQLKLNTLNEEEASAQPEQPDEEEGAGLHAKAIQDPAEGAASASAAADEGAAGNLVKHVKKRRLYRPATRMVAVPPSSSAAEVAQRGRRLA